MTDHRKTFFAPRHMVEGDGHSRLFKCVGISRDMRRRYPGGEEWLAAALLIPKERVIRFWLMAWPQWIGHRPQRKNMQPSVDLAWLRGFYPEVKDAPLHQGPLLEEFPTLRTLGEDLPARITHIETARIAIDLRPFAAWSKVKTELDRWETLDKQEREALAEGVAALDGISYSRMFSDAAVRRVPTFAQMLDSLLDSDNTQVPSQPEAPDTPSIPVTEPGYEVSGWKEVLADIAKYTQDSIEAPPSGKLIDRIRSDADRLSNWLTTHEVAARANDRFRADLGDLVGRLRQSARECELEWLSDLRLDELEKRWLGWFEIARPDDGSNDDFSTFARRAEELLADLEARHRAKRALDDQLARLGTAAGRGTSPGERKAAILARGQLESQRTQCEASIAELEEVLEALVPETRGDRRPEVPAPIVGDPTPGGEPIDDLSIGEGAQPGVEDSGEPATVAVATPPVPNVPEPEPPTLAPSGPMAPAGSGADTESGELPAAFDNATGELCRPVWDALRSDQHALAYQLASALAACHPGLKVPPLPLLRALALAGFVESRHGECADELSAAYADINPDDLVSGPSDWRTALSFLLIAATLKPCLIAPTSGATGMIEYAHPHGAVHDLRKAVVDAGNALQGLNISQASFHQIRGQSDWNTDRRSVDEALAEWQRKSPKTTLNFQAATEVWLRLQAPSGRFGQLVELLRGFDPDKVDYVRSEIAELRDPQGFRRLVNEIDRKQLKRTRGEEIHARAFQQLKDRAADVFGLAEQWIQLMQRSPQHDGFLSGMLRTLLDEVRRLQPNVESDLATLCGTGDRWGLIAAGANAVRFAVREFLALETAPLADTGEATTSELLGRCLLMAREIELNDDWIPSQKPAEIIAAAAPLATAFTDPIDVVNHRIEVEDFRGARRLLLSTSAQYPQSKSESLLLRIEDATKVSRSRLIQKIEQARNALESALASGHLNEQERGPLDAKLVALTEAQDGIDQFGPANSVIRSVHDAIEDLRRRRVDEARSRIAQFAPGPGHTAAQRLDAALQSGDLFVVYEYLQLLKDGQALPEPEPTPRDPFRDFFPEGAKRAETVLVKAETTSALVEAIRQGRIVQGMDFSQVASAQRTSGGELASTWFALKRSPEAATDGQIAAIFLTLGFVGPSARRVKGPRRGIEFDVSVEPLGDRTICPVPYFGSQAGGHYRVVCISGRPVDEDILRMIGDTTTRPTIALYLGRLSETQRRELARASRSERRTCLVIDDVLMLHLCAERGSRLSAFFASTLPFTSAEPFGATSGLVPPEMFFGRKDEIKAITSPTGGCFVYGGRQLGKTALLRAAERTFKSPAEKRYASWIDLKHEGLGQAREASDLWGVVHRELRRLGGEFADLEAPKANRQRSVDVFLQQLRDRFDSGKRNRLLLLLDEADAFLEQDSQAAFAETMRLKNLMESTGRNVKVVFAGLHNVLRVTEQANHPLAHLGDPIEVGPLTKPGESLEARNMIVGPLLAAGYELASPDLATRILAQTNYYPVLIQLYGEELIRVMNDANGRRPELANGPRYQVTGATIDDTYRKKALRDAIRLRLQYTLQLDPRYEVIAYTLAFAALDRGDLTSDAADPAEIKKWATSWWPEGFGGTSEHEFRILLDEMVGLGVLRHDGPRAYGMRNPNVLRLLGTERDIGEVLGKKREPPPAFTPSVFRRPIANAPGRNAQRSPLSFTQESQLVAPANAVSIIAGSDAAGLSDLRAALTSLNIEAVWAEGAMDLPGLQKALTRLADGRKEGTSVFVVPSDVPWTAPWVERAHAKLRSLMSKDRHLRVVFVADPQTLLGIVPDLAQLQRSDVELTTLRPWTDAFVQRWLEDIQVVGDSKEREQLKEISGYWPSLLMQLPDSCHQIRQLTEAIDTVLKSAQGRDRMRKAFGLDDHVASAVIKLVGDLAGEPIEVLAEFASSENPRGIDMPDLTARLEWAEILQLILPYEGGWQVDPVVGRLLA